MRKLLLKWILMAASVVVASLACQSAGLGFEADFRTVESVLRLLLGVALLGLLNATLRPILKFLSLPLTCLTFGLFSLVVNAAVLWIAASFELGFRITASGFQGFLAALAASVLISIVSAILGVFLPEDRDD